MSDDVNGWTGVMDALQAWALRILVVGAVLLVAVQAVMVNPKARRFLSLTEKLEGIPWNEYSGDSQPVNDPYGANEANQGQYGVPETVMVTLKLVGLKSLEGSTIMVNDEPMADFDFSSATLEVHAGDKLSIDFRRLSMPVRVRVSSVSPGVMAPREGDIYEALEGQDDLAIGRVVVSHLARANTKSSSGN